MPVAAKDLVIARMCTDCTMIQDMLNNNECQNCGVEDVIVPIYIAKVDAELADNRNSCGFSFVEQDPNAPAITAS